MRIARCGSCLQTVEFNPELESRAVRCPHCNQIFTMAEHQPPVAAPVQPAAAAPIPLENKVTCGLSLLIVVVSLGVLIWACSPKKSDSPSADAGPPSESAILTTAKHAGLSYAQKLIPHVLKAPSTAQFPRESVVAKRARTITPDCFIVTGAVDSQNGFGAMIRGHWEIRLVLKDKLWRTYRVSMNGEVLTDLTKDWNVHE